VEIIRRATDGSFIPPLLEGDSPLAPQNIPLIHPKITLQSKNYLSL